MIDFRRYYNLERYLLDDVGPAFRASGRINPDDFYAIIIWKANRSKSKEKNRLERLAGSSFSAAVTQIAAALHAAHEPRRRLEILMSDWKFRLPMASAVLSILYPREFTVYDVRVCGVLGRYEKLANRKFGAGLWLDYNRFIRDVRAAAPAGLSLRDADRYLWGKSFFDGMIRDFSC
jgi:hypothetical protein